MNKLQDHLYGAGFLKLGIRVGAAVFLLLAAPWFSGEALAADNTFTLLNTTSSRQWSLPASWTGGPSGDVPLTVADKVLIPGSTATSTNLVVNMDNIHVSELEVATLTDGVTQRLEASGNRSITIDKLLKNGSYTFVVRNGGSSTLSLNVGTLEMNTGTMELGGGLTSPLEEFVVTGSSVVKGNLIANPVGTLSLGGLNLSGSVTLGGRGASANVLTVSSLTGNGAVQVSQSSTHYGTAGKLEIDSTNVDPITFSGILRDYANSSQPAVLSVTKKGAGEQILTGTISYTGATKIEAGRLTIAGSSINNKLNASSGILITGGALDYRNNSIALATTTVTLNGGTLLYNSTQAMTAAITFTSGTIGGTGTINQALTIGAGMTLSPGNSPGSQTFASNQTWVEGGNYNWQVYNATGVAGTGYDTLTVSGTLNLMGLTDSKQFNLNLWSLSSVGPDVNGSALNFDPQTGASWLLVSADQITYDTNFDIATLFNINISAFNGTGGFANPIVGAGSFNVSVDGGNLWLNYAPIPEPGVAGLGGVGLLMLGLRFKPMLWTRFGKFAGSNRAL